MFVKILHYPKSKLYNWIWINKSRNEQIKVIRLLILQINDKNK